VLLAANPTVQKTEDLDRQLITLLAILVLTVVCFLHYFSRNSGLLLNLLFSAYKICLIVVFIIAGGVAYGTSTDRPNDWNDQPVGKKDALAALIYIIYSYQGWENANYVRGFTMLYLKRR
jgi:amino acid transporter